jgi:UDP-N-acetylmuramoyl-L-alanyl-D-glutamate--2,6-diaminopimelate ligase
VAKGVAFEEGVKLLETLPAIPGRMQRIAERPGRPLVVVDYAHTPDALDQVLRALRPVAQARDGRLAVVFGAGGGRDASKRPAMGKVASALADCVVLTSDNPRGEDPLAIIEQVRRGISGKSMAETDRAKAIETAIASAAAADVVLIAGKGHEEYQEIAGTRRPFSDAKVAAAALGRRGDR